MSDEFSHRNGPAKNLLRKPPNPFMKEKKKGKMNKYMYINNKSRANIQGTKLIAHYCAGISGMGSGHFIMPTLLCSNISIMHSAVMLQRRK